MEAFDKELYPRIKFRMMDQIKASFAKTLEDYVNQKMFQEIQDMTMNKIISNDKALKEKTDEMN